MHTTLSVGLQWVILLLAVFICCTENTDVVTPDVSVNSLPQFLLWYEDTTVVAGRVLTLQLIAKDDDGDTLRFYSIKKPSAAVLDSITGLFYWKTQCSTSALGVCTTIVEVRDPDTCAYDTVYITVSTGNAPVFTCKDTVDGNAGYELRYQIRANDADKDILTYFTRLVPDTGMSVDSSSGLFTWTPALSLVDSVKMCEVYVTDGLTEDTLSLYVKLHAPTKRRVPDQYKKIQSAVDSARSGDTILVAPGTYSENIDFKGKMLILASKYLETGDTGTITETIIDGMSKAPCIIISYSPQGTRVCGFTIKNGCGNGNQGGGVHIVSSPAQIDHCVITNCRSEGG